MVCLFSHFQLKKKIDADDSLSIAIDELNEEDHRQQQRQLQQQQQESPTDEQLLLLREAKKHLEQLKEQQRILAEQVETENSQQQQQQHRNPTSASDTTGIAGDATNTICDNDEKTREVVASKRSLSSSSKKGDSSPIDIRDQERPAPVGEETEKPARREEKRGAGVGSCVVEGETTGSDIVAIEVHSRRKSGEGGESSGKKVHRSKSEKAMDVNGGGGGGGSGQNSVTAAAGMKQKRSASTQWAPDETQGHRSGRRGVVSAPDGSGAPIDARPKSGDENATPRHKRTPNGQSGKLVLFGSWCGSSLLRDRKSNAKKTIHLVHMIFSHITECCCCCGVFVLFFASKY